MPASQPLCSQKAVDCFLTPASPRVLDGVSGGKETQGWRDLSLARGQQLCAHLPGVASLSAPGGTGMICPCCLGKRLVLIVRLEEGASLRDQAATSTYEQECPECHGFGIVHCCDGLTACAASG